MKARHMPFRVTPKGAEIWVAHMKAAMDEVGIKEEPQKALSQFFERWRSPLSLAHARLLTRVQTLRRSW